MVSKNPTLPQTLRDLISNEFYSLDMVKGKCKLASLRLVNYVKVQYREDIYCSYLTHAHHILVLIRNESLPVTNWYQIDEYFIIFLCDKIGLYKPQL